ncbi:MAG: zinc ribbon domain-containing protein [Arenicellales bacterium]
MPLYEYECGACGHRLEALQKISDDPLVYCPECNEARLKKLISAAAFRLKGTGWYETDFKNKESAKKEDKKGGKASTGPDAESKSESKTESTAESKSDSGDSTKSDSKEASSVKTKNNDSGSTGQSAGA